MTEPGTPDTGSPETFYATGGNGVYLSNNAGTNWAIASLGMPGFPINTLAADPSSDGNTIAYTTEDWFAFYTTDGTGEQSAQTWQIPSQATNLKGYSAAFDPRHRYLFVGGGQKQANAGGVVVWQDPTVTGGPTSTAWTDLGFPSDADCTGLYVGYDGGGNQFILAASDGDGLWRYSAGQWTQCSTSALGAATLCQATSTVVPIVSQLGSTWVYLFDRNTGIWRSGSFGAPGSWVNIWSAAQASGNTGWIALNPTVADGELWVAEPNGLYKVTGPSGTNVGTATVDNGDLTATQMPAATFTNPGAGVAFTANGTIYALNMGSATEPLVQLLQSEDGGSHWANVGAPTVAQTVGKPKNLVIGQANSRQYITGYNVYSTGSPGSDWTTLGENLHPGANQYAGAAAQQPAGTSPVNATVTISPATWIMAAIPVEVSGAHAAITGSGSITAPPVTLDGVGSVAVVVAGGQPVTVPEFDAGYAPLAADFDLWIQAPFAYLTSKAVFRAALNSGPVTLTSGQSNLIPFDTVIEDPYGGWQAADSQWQCPPGMSGTYLVSITVAAQGSNDEVSTMRAQAGLNGAEANTVGIGWVPSNQIGLVSGSVPMQLFGGQDTVCAYAFWAGNSNGQVAWSGGRHCTLEISWYSL